VDTPQRSVQSKAHDINRVHRSRGETAAIYCAGPQALPYPYTGAWALISDHSTRPTMTTPPGVNTHTHARSHISISWAVTPPCTEHLLGNALSCPAEHAAPREYGRVAWEAVMEHVVDLRPDLTRR
jgi:hypothetical protein